MPRLGHKFLSRRKPISGGDVFGKLTVDREIDSIRRGHRVYRMIRCICTCGAVKEITYERLKRGHTTSCGCGRRTVQSSDLAGMRFGDLVILREVESRTRGKYKYRYVAVRCSCGTEKNVKFATLQQKDGLRSCGCRLRRKGDKHHCFRGAGCISGSKWSRIVNCAKERGIPVLITKEDALALFVEQNGKCSLSGISLVMGITNATASLDRIDSSLPYQKGNIQWVHKDINRMKLEMSQRAFIEMCEKITNHQKEKQQWKPEITAA